jgi:hypothetical protein
MSELILPFRKVPRQHDRTSFFKYMTAPTARIVLATRKLRWSSPILFPDPFDVPINLELPFKTAELQHKLVHIVADMMESGKEFQHPDLVSLAGRLKALSNEDEVRRLIIEDLRAWPDAGVNVPSLKEIQAHWEKLRPDMRILCLCERNNITPMWTIYAQNHTGAVFEFTDHKYIDTPIALARRVIYRAEPPRLATMEEWIDSILHIRKLSLQDFFADYQYVKGNDWAHEFEWRLISYKRHGESGLYADWGFDPGELTAIYLGSRISDDDACVIKALLTHGLEHVKLFKAVENQQQLKMTFELVA